MAIEREVYDAVWVMENNRPQEKVIFAVVKSMNYDKKGVDVFYHLTYGTWGVGWGNNEGNRYPEEMVFDSKEEVLATL